MCIIYLEVNLKWGCTLFSKNHLPNYIMFNLNFKVTKATFDIHLNSQEYSQTAFVTRKWNLKNQFSHDLDIFVQAKAVLSISILFAKITNKKTGELQIQIFRILLKRFRLFTSNRVHRISFTKKHRKEKFENHFFNEYPSKCFFNVVSLFISSDTQLRYDNFSTLLFLLTSI